MAWKPDHLSSSGLLRRLAADQSGNTIMLVAASLVPLVAMLGSGVDISRAYVTESRLQQACDAGVLAARKKIGADLPPSGTVVGQASQTGKKFFDLNFTNGRYDTTGRDFQMTLEADYSVSGVAKANMPTTLMSIFGYNEVPIEVNCQARMNFTNIDIMMAIDVTGSMRHTNAGDTNSRIESVRQVVQNFYTNIETGKPTTTRTRYGFVPYASNVNVGHLLQNSWVVNDWTYQSREDGGTNSTVYQAEYYSGWTKVSGDRTGWFEVERYNATWNDGTPPSGGSGDTNPTTGTSGYWSCNGNQPSSTWVESNYQKLGESSETVTDPDGTRTVQDWQKTNNGTRYQTRRVDSTCIVEGNTDTNYVETYQFVSEPRYSTVNNWIYQSVDYNVSNWRNNTSGCIEERKSTEVGDWSNVDLAQNLDLDIDLVPTSSDDTKWRPHWPEHIWTRKIDVNGNGSFDPNAVTTSATYAKTGEWWMSGCPAQAQRLEEMTATEVSTYLAGLTPAGATYHDIGMIWAGRLISPTGLFASDNADVSANKPTSRHVIFLTDGQTEPYDVAYGAYGVEPLDQRRWSEASTLTLAETVEQRFLFACNEVKKRNVTVWIIAFGTYANQTMKDCAGPGYYFEAADADQLDSAFNTIAQSLGDLRITE